LGILIMANMMRKSGLAAGMLTALALPSNVAQSQSGVAAPAAATPAGPAVGDVAPDFTATGATRYGVLRNPVRLSDFRGRTVVLAFFVKARTKG
jgi:peroxiredoxin Q/BCP